MNTAYLLIGTNLGNKKENIQLALTKIESSVGIISSISSIYETSPWGITDQPSFYNCVLELKTDLPATVLLSGLLSIEQEMGRERIHKWSERIIDLDILYFNDAIINSVQLKIPHPELHNRKFTLVPLCSLAPNYMHPIFRVTNATLLDRCTDNGLVNLIL